MPARRYQINEAKKFLSVNEYRKYRNDQEKLNRGDVQENQLPRQVPAPGTVKLQNGHFTDEIRMEGAELYVKADYNMNKALRLFKAAHGGWPSAIIPIKSFFHVNTKNC